MTSDAGAAAAGPSGGGLPGLRDGDVIRLGAQAVRDPRGGSPLVMQREARVAAGQRGKLPAREQAAAIQEVLAWVACERSPEDKPGDGTRRG